MTNIFPTDFAEKTTPADNDKILLADSADSNKIKYGKYSSFKGATGDTGPAGADGADGVSFIRRGAYSGATAYVVNDVVSYNGSSYICILASTGNLPTNVTYWSLFAEKGADGSGAGDMLKSENLSGLSDYTIARSNLGVPAGSGSSTGTNTGDQTNITGNAGTATALQNARTINGVSFNGTSNITVPSDIAPGTSGNVLTSNGSVWTSAAPTGSGYSLLAQASLGSAGTSLSSGTFSAKNFLKIIIYIPTSDNTTGATPGLQFNSDTGNNYSYHNSLNGGAAAGVTGTNIALLQLAGTRVLANADHTTITLDISNISTTPKMGVLQSTYLYGNPATVPYVNVGSICWTNTSNQITSILLTTSGGTVRFASGTKISILGMD